MTREEKKLIQETAIDHLKNINIDINKLFIQIVERSRTGMSDNLQVLAIDNNEIVDISRFVAYAIDCDYTKNRLIRITGCGYSKELYIREALKNALK